LSVAGVSVEHVFESEYDVPAQLAVLLGATPGELLDHLEVERPGAWMLSVLDHLREEELSDADRERVLGCWDRFSAWTALRRAEAMVDATTEHEQVSGPFGVDDFGQEVVALVTGLSLNSAANELTTARTVVRELPGVRSALERGAISWLMARAVADATAALPAWARVDVDRAMMATWDIDRDLPAWRRKLRREVLKADTTAAEAKRQRAVADRRVAFWPLPDGMAALYAEVPAEAAITAMNALTKIAQGYKAGDREQVKAGALTEGRTMDQARADALIDLCASALASDDVSPAVRGKVTVQVTGGIKTLLGLRDDPGELTGYGPITAEHLRELAADGEWHRFLTADDTGALIAIGQATYRPKAVLRRFLRAATPACDFPGCPIPAERCDAEHTKAHGYGGATDEANMCPRCRRHHRCKTHADWKVEKLPNGYTAWTTPAGTTRLIAPYRLAGDESDDPDDPDDPDDEHPDDDHPGE
jgi:hypothetical protein